MNYSNTVVNQMLATLTQDFSDQRHEAVLALFTLTGVADRQHVYQATGLTRHKFNTLLHHFRQLAGAQILHKVSQSVPQPGYPGRPPTLYTLGPAGAALARGLGYKRIRPCQMQDPKTLAHARAIVTVALAAREQGLSVVVEKELPYGEAQVIRPDLVITLPSGEQALFEIEQDAGYHTLKLKTATQARRAAFFQTEAAAEFSPVIRTLFNLTPGRTWETTIATWERANANVANTLDGELPYEHLALPLVDFLKSPDWQAAPETQRWTALIDPAQAADFGLESSAEETKITALAELPDSSAPLAKSPTSFSVRYSRLVLRAYVQHLQQHGLPDDGAEGPPLPSPEFFELWQVIYAPSHPLNPTPYQQASYPRASLYLLRTYLTLHPALRKALSKAIRRGGGSVRWSASLILHRMQNIIEVFLRYHGYRSSPALRVVPVPSWHRSTRKNFGVQVKINAELLMPAGEDGLLPCGEEVQHAEQALDWLLSALFSYAEELELPHAKFW